MGWTSTSTLCYPCSRLLIDLGPSGLCRAEPSEVTPLPLEARRPKTMFYIQGGQFVICWGVLARNSRAIFGEICFIASVLTTSVLICFVMYFTQDRKFVWSSGTQVQATDLFVIPYLFWIFRCFLDGIKRALWQFIWVRESEISPCWSGSPANQTGCFPWRGDLATCESALSPCCSKPR
jgi:hypothetical protein